MFQWTFQDIHTSSPSSSYIFGFSKDDDNVQWYLHMLTAEIKGDMMMKLSVLWLILKRHLTLYERKFSLLLKLLKHWVYGCFLGIRQLLINYKVWKYLSFKGFCTPHPLKMYLRYSKLHCTSVQQFGLCPSKLKYLFVLK